MKRYLHVVRPPVVAGIDLDILESYAVFDYFALAAELWRLAGRPERGSAIEEAVSHAYDYDVPLLTTPDIENLLESLSGIDETVYGALTNESHEIPVEKLPELRTRTQLLDIGEYRGNDAVFAVQEALIDVHNLASALRSARDQGAHITFD
jgi:hypothetical protein